MEDVLKEFGFPIFACFVLGSVIVYMARRDERKQSKIDGMYEQQLNDARTTRDKINVYMEQQSKLTEKMYDIVLSIYNQRKD